MRWGFSLFLLLICNIVVGQTEDVEREISALMKKYGAVGVSVAVVKDNNVVYTNSFGYKDLRDSIPLQKGDLFRIASITKTFVATAIMQLVEDGKVSLEDDVNRFLRFKVQNPKFPEKTITIKMLMGHRSSINDSQGYKDFGKIIDASRSLSEKCFSNDPPGSAFQYCNLNYNLLGAIIENVTGKRFDKYIEKAILKPLKLQGRFDVLELDSNTFVRSYWYNKISDDFTYVNDTYSLYEKEMDNYILGYSTPFLSAAGGLKISAPELSRYMIMHMNDGYYKKKKIIKRESERLLRQVPFDNHWYALSISHYNNIILQGEELLGQTGGAHGIHTAMIFHPEKNYGFVVFCNGCKCISSDMDGHELNFDIIRSLYRIVIN